MFSRIAPRPQGNDLDFKGEPLLSPKQDRRLQTGWEGFFPYYAGYPEAFAESVIEQVDLRPGAVVLDPWNGSGTTTYVAAKLGLNATGLDINPVMVVVARARLLPASEADAIGSLADQIIKRSRTVSALDTSDPLLVWFSRRSAATIRAIECSIREYLVSDFTLSPEGVRLENLSGVAATFYVALFALCRRLTRHFQASNPTWLKIPSADSKKISEPPSRIVEAFKSNLRGMASALRDRGDGKIVPRSYETHLRVADSTAPSLKRASVDLILTSPPYCTRIDYTSATRIELAILAPLVEVGIDELRRQMIGSIRVPVRELSPQEDWGATCNKFLRKVRRHPSKASAGYYYQTHLDYFSKMSQSIARLSGAIRRDGDVIFVVQDSFYKDIHNDLPAVMVDMFEANGLQLYRREDFRIPRSMAGINRYTKLYNRDPGATEAVLFFAKA